MFEWKIASEICLQCPFIEHAVGVWRDKTDFIFACSNDWIFTIRVADNSCVFLEQRKKFQSYKYPLWSDLLPQIEPTILVSNFFMQFCKTENQEYFIISRDPKFLFSPISSSFQIENLLDANFINTSVVLLFPNIISITQCSDWWSEDAPTSSVEIENDSKYLRLISNFRKFIAYGDYCAAIFDKKGNRLWQQKFEQKISLLWFFSSGFQVAIVLENGTLLLFDTETGKSLLEKSSQPIQIHKNTHVVMKNSTNTDGNAFYLITQLDEPQNEQFQTWIRQISAHRTELQ